MTKINELYKPLLDNHLEAVASSQLFSSRRSLGGPTGYSKVALKHVESKKKAHTGFYVHSTAKKDLAKHSLNTQSQSKGHFDKHRDEDEKNERKYSDENVNNYKQSHTER